MEILRRYVKFVDKANEKIGVGISWLTTIMIVVVCYDVFTRYVLKKSAVAVQEIEWHLFSIIFLVGAAYTLKHDKHVRVDIIYSRLSCKAKAWINLVGTVLFLVPFTILIIWASRNYVTMSFQIREVSSDPGGLPARYILKGCIPFGSGLLFFQGFSLMFKSILDIFSKKLDDQLK